MGFWAWLANKMVGAISWATGPMTGPTSPLPEPFPNEQDPEPEPDPSFLDYLTEFFDSLLAGDVMSWIIVLGIGLFLLWLRR